MAILDAVPLPSSPVLAGFALFGYALLAIVGANVFMQLLPKPKSDPPLVFHFFPVIGSAVMYGMDPYKFLFSMREKHGNVFSFILLGRKVTVALGPAGSNLILNGKLSQVNAEDAYTHLTTPVFGTDVVYDCPNHMLMEQKKFVKYGLSTENFRAYIPIVAREVRQYLDEHVFSTSTDGGATSKPLDAFKRTSEITICTAAATLQGQEVRNALGTDYAEVYHDLDGGFTPLNFVFPNLPLPSYRKRDVAHVKMRMLYLDIMNRRRQEGRDDSEDMLQALQGQTYRDGRALTDKEIAHIMIALLMAGQHTSAATSSWLLLHLGEMPELQQALYEEQVATYGNGDGTFRPVDFDTYQTPLLMAIIKEVLRLHPPLHSLMRHVVSDLPVPPSLAAPNTGAGKDGNDFYVVRKGGWLLAAPGVSHVDPLIWDNAQTFDPHRWLSPDSIVKEAAEDEGEKIDFGWGAISTGANSPYLPFGAGRHRCIGEQFANVQLGTLMATLIRECTWELQGAFPKQDYTTMIVSPTKPCDVVFRRRK